MKVQLLIDWDDFEKYNRRRTETGLSNIDFVTYCTHLMYVKQQLNQVISRWPIVAEGYLPKDPLVE